MNPTASPRRKFGWASLVALALVPLLAVAALIGLAWSSESDVKAAVVNLNVLKTLGFDAAPATMEEFVAACKEKAAGSHP